MSFGILEKLIMTIMVSIAPNVMSAILRPKKQMGPLLKQVFPGGIE